MLPNHAPLVIAEQFGTLDALYPGRIDLGLGRAPGSDQLTARALRRNLASSGDTFPQDVLELQSYFEPAEPDQALQAVPGAGANVPLYLLGSSDFSARLAAELGLPFAFASHFAPDYLDVALALYRQNFQPSAALEKPHAMIGVGIFAAETDAEAQRLFTSSQLQFLNMVRGRPGKLPPPVETMDGSGARRNEPRFRNGRAVPRSARRKQCSAGWKSCWRKPRRTKSSRPRRSTIMPRGCALLSSPPACSASSLGRKPLLPVARRRRHDNALTALRDGENPLSIRGGADQFGPRGTNPQFGQRLGAFGRFRHATTLGRAVVDRVVVRVVACVFRARTWKPRRGSSSTASPGKCFAAFFGGGVCRATFAGSSSARGVGSGGADNGAVSAASSVRATTGAGTLLIFIRYRRSLVRFVSLADHRRRDRVGIVRFRFRQVRLHRLRLRRRLRPRLVPTRCRARPDLLSAAEAQLPAGYLRLFSRSHRAESRRRANRRARWPERARSHLPCRSSAQANHSAPLRLR